MSENIEMTVEKACCPIRHMLDIIGGKWKLPILCILSEEKPVRYNSIKRKLGGITNMMLSQSLKELESYGMLKRIQYNEVPPRVEYELSEKGKSLMPILENMAGWGAESLNETKQRANCASCRKIK